MANISDAIKSATKILDRNGIKEARNEARSLLSFALKKDKAFLIAHSEYKLSKMENKTFQALVKRRAQREPFQHITGKQEFWRYDFIVSPDVLIPRSETELIVENAIDILRSLKNPKFCEIGVGSGCISVSILKDVKEAQALGVDISEKAIAIAQQNASIHKVSDRLTLEISDVFEGFEKSIGQFDLIVSNPPYIPSKDISELQKEVRDFDPHIALTDGQDGLSIIRRIIDDAPKYLSSNGYLLIEIGINQAKQVREMFDPKIWKDPEFKKDLQAIPRMVKACLM